MGLSFLICFNNRSFRFSTVLSFFLILIPFLSKGEVDLKNGEQLFKANCVSCHYNPDKDATLVGPSLKNIEKTKSEEWLIKWIKNNSALRKSGDKDAIAIWEEFGKTEMPTYPSMSDDDVKSILAYIKAESEKVVAAPVAGTGATQTETSAEGGDYTVILIIVIVVLILLALMVKRVNSNLKRIIEEKEEGKTTEPKPFWKQIIDKQTGAFLILILMVVSGYKMVEYTQKLGHSKDYQPTQPIKFSHKVHAGQNQINCLYCHAGAEKSKTASIPSTNVCMNCHKAIKEGPRTGTKEIDKIYAAFDNKTPVKWVKIHNLPDHVYFNHSQHVAVGKIECQTCHGPVEKMDEVYQFASLSMGWCVNCHRQTGVQFTENKYYGSVYENLHKDLKDGKIKTVTEEMMGGTECQKCHY